MSEWFMELVLKTSDAARHRGFESLSLRQFFNSILSWRSTQVAVRGSPAKGVGSAKGREGSNPSFSAKNKQVVLFYKRLAYLYFLSYAAME